MLSRKMAFTTLIPRRRRHLNPIKSRELKKKKKNLRTLFVILHVRLGHHDFHYMRKLYPILGNSLDFSKLKYEICELAKNQRVSYPISGKRSEISFSIIHINAWVSSRVTSISSARWFLCLIDHYCRTTWIYLLKNKFETIAILDICFLMV